MEIYTSLNVFAQRNESYMNKIMRAHNCGFFNYEVHGGKILKI